MTMPDSWLQAIAQPALSVTSPFTLRLTLARLIRSSQSAGAAIQTGLRADTPATAFLAGYQCAMRFIDPALEPEQWGAFCVSEKGLGSLSNMQTTYDRETSLITGVKSHAMLARSVIDWFYVVARDSASGDLVCVRCRRGAQGTEAGPDPVNQAFVPEVPHNSVSFGQVRADDAFLVDDAHNSLNKPFRFHEDYLCALAIGGWMLRQVVNRETEAVRHLAATLSDAKALYPARASGYSAELMTMFDALAAAITGAAKFLAGEAALQWQRDRVLLVMGEKARAVLRLRLFPDISDSES